MAMATPTKDEEKKHQSAPRRGVRSFWSGTISFALVNVPVHLFPANRNTSVSLRMLDQDGTPLSRRYYCPEHNRDIHPEHIIRGFPLEGTEDEYVIVRDDELQSLEPKKTREIDLRRFVDLNEISPMLFERAYYLTPGGDTNKAYRLLAAVMEESGKAGIATFVMRDREYLIAILAENGILRAQTMRFADELRTPEFVGLPEPEKPPSKQLAAIEKLIKRNTQAELDTSLLKDDFAERLKKLVEKKRKDHQDVVQTTTAQKGEAEDPENEEAGIDLLESIRLSLRGEDGFHAKRKSHRDGKDSSKSGGSSKAQAAGGLEKETKEELYDQAKKLDIPGRSKLSKEELIRAIRQAKA